MSKSSQPPLTYYCVFCNEKLIADEFGVYVHKEAYHHTGCVYMSQPDTYHVIPIDTLRLRH